MKKKRPLARGREGQMTANSGGFGLQPADNVSVTGFEGQSKLGDIAVIYAEVPGARGYET
jgi:hypothetical protein